jgi:hypothetical protein
MSQVSRATAERMQGEPMPEYLRKCLEIQAYLGEPLYCEWCEAGPDDNAAFEQYVNDEFAKLFPTTINVTHPEKTPANGLIILDDPRTVGQREDAERDADWQRQTSELRDG